MAGEPASFRRTESQQPTNEVRTAVLKQATTNETRLPDSSGDVDAHDEHVRTIFGVLEGEREADLLLRNLNILDVHSESVYQGRSWCTISGSSH